MEMEVSSDEIKETIKRVVVDLTTVPPNHLAELLGNLLNHMELVLVEVEDDDPESSTYIAAPYAKVIRAMKSQNTQQSIASIDPTNQTIH